MTEPNNNDSGNRGQQGDPAGSGNPGQQGDPAAGGNAEPPTSGGNAGDAARELAAMRRALNAANRESADFRAKLKEFEDRDKSELEKANERATAAETRAAELERNYLRSQVALAKGLPANLAARLQGSTKEELEADADALKALIAPNNNNGQPPPRPDLGQGARGTASPPSADAWLRGMAGRRR